MTITDWLNESAAQRDGLGDRVSAKSSLLEKLRLFLLRRRIDAMLRRTVAPMSYENASALPPHLMRDIGLTPPM